MKFLFVCYGNICRSPIAEFVFKYITKGEDFYITSKAVSSEELGNPIYPPAKTVMRKNNIPFDEHYATKMTANDLEEFDYILCMDALNMRLIKALGNTNNVYKLLDFTKNPHDVADPWYSGDFDTAFDDIMQGCQALYQFIKDQKAK